MADSLRTFILAIALGHAALAGAESVSPWVIDDATDASTEFRVRLKSTVFAANDFAPAIHFAREAQNAEHPPKPGTNRALVVAQAGAYFDYLGFQLGAFRRVDGHGVADGEAITAIQAVNSKTNLDIGRTYSGGYSYQLIDMEGIRLGKTVNLPMPEDSRWSGAAGVGFSLLHGVSVRQDVFFGSLTYSSPDAYLLDGKRSQSNSRVKATDYNAYLQNGTPRANGYTSDFGMTLQHASGIRIYLISDLASKLNWHDVPSRNYSVQGYTGSPGTPLPSGFASTAPFSNELSVKTTVGMLYPIQSFAIEGAVTHIGGLNDPTLAVKHDVAWGWSARISVHPYWRALGLEFSHPVFGKLRIISDATSVTRARTLGLKFETGFAF